ncbi:MULTISPECIES: lamin tail domain-containing protein [unclassified Streptomyces]|uniref:lamin tail domain-containing protein n=1 Tax=unclassified Streptomyces TaxID=2593676 RepID=UPI0028C3D70B|nr:MULTISPECIES: lamin tail domain-containing protein [unclassified Streptomyces]WNO73398.1 lamin tail domain-containing protein [Streptomyces sp. AM8-1-1]
MSASRTARTLVATTMATGAVVTALAMPAVAADRGHDHGHDRGPSKSAIELGRIQYDSPGREDNSNRSRNAEWVDIKNTSRKPVKLNGWTLTDKAGHRYTFRHFTLAGRSTVRVHTGIGHDTRTDVFQDRRNYVWDNKDKAILKDRRGHVVDSKSWNRR